MNIRKALGIGFTAGLLGLVCGLNNRIAKNDQVEVKPTDSQIEEVKFHNPWTNKPFEFEKSDRKNDRIDVFAEYTAGFEGCKNKVYDPNPNDGKPEPTIGIGHYMDRGDSRETFARVFGKEVDWDSIFKGRTHLTNEQSYKLLAYDLPMYVERVERLVPRFDEFPVDVQKVLVDKAYRGDLGDSPKACALMRLGRIRQAAEEFINRKDYRDAESNGMSGVKKRLDSHNSTLLQYASSLESIKSTQK